MRSKNSLILILALGLILHSCSKTSNTSKSLTGWKDNDDEGWYFSGDKDPGNGGPGMVFIEGGTFTKGQTKDNVMHDWNNTPVRQEVRSFYLSETEVTNRDYKMYLSWIRLFFNGDDLRYKEIYKGSLPDTIVWRNKLANQELFVQNYFRDPAFDHYPIVGINWLQANNYADWLTDRVNEKELIKNGTIDKELYVYSYSDSAYFENNKPAFFSGRYKELGNNMFGPDSDIFTENQKNNKAQIASKKTKNRKFLGFIRNKGVRNKNTGTSYKTYNQKWKKDAQRKSTFSANYRLPTETEWEYAALALSKNREYNRYKGKIIPELKLRKERGRKKGSFIANIKRGRGDYSGVSGWQNDGYSITSPVKAFKPNALGLYGMYGNVAEWTSDVYRPIIDEQASDFNYYRGNTFEKTIREDGIAEIVGIDIIYDTLKDGRLVYRELPGQIKRKVYEDNRNYRDGDFQSLIDPYKHIDADGNEINSATDLNPDFNSPKQSFIVSEDGHVIMQKDKSSVSTDISDRNRVIKGGSWKDRVYWTDPGQRRYMLETSSASWLGFRVAHDKLGDDSKSNRSIR